MSTSSRALTVRLDEEDFARLEREASRLGMRPGTLARVLLRASLGERPTERGDVPVSLDRLFARLAELREGLPATDAAAVIDAGRAMLDQRSKG